MKQGLTPVALSLALGIGMAACGGRSAEDDAGPGGLPDGAADASSPRTTGPLAWAGVHDAEGVWDLSGPLAAQQTVGEVVAELLIQEIVTRAGVPDALEDQGRSAVRSLVGDEIRSAVDATTPEALRPGSDLRVKLAAVLATTQVTSVIALNAAAPAGTVRGTEELRAFRFAWLGLTSTLAASDLQAGSSPGVPRR